MISFTPAAKWHCRSCDDLFVDADFTLRRGKKISDNGDFYRTVVCPSCKSANIERAWAYRERLAAMRTNGQT
jgi:hypothetical protein